MPSPLSTTFLAAAAVLIAAGAPGVVAFVLVAGAVALQVVLFLAAGVVQSPDDDVL